MYVDFMGLDFTYSQNSGVLQNSDTGKKYQCYSGSESGGGKNDPTKQDQADNGPLPQGDWKIGDHDNSKGPLTIDLNPQDGNDVYDTNRDPDSFRAHGDSADHPGDASHGCLVCGKPARQDMINSGGTISVIK